jgi:integrase
MTATVPVPIIASLAAASPPAEERTLYTLLDIYEREILSQKGSWTIYTTHLLYRRVRVQLGDLALTELTPEVLRAWRDTLRGRYGPSTVRRYLYALRGPLTSAVRYYGWLSANPMDKVLFPSDPDGRIRYLSPEEQGRLLAACRRSDNPYLYPAVLVALHTGGRKNEVMHLRWRDVDLTQGVVRFMHTKNKERRAVPVAGAALASLRERSRGQQPDAWVFPAHDGRKPIHIEAAWQTAKRRAGLADFHFHDLRHTAASYLAMSGATLLDIATILGHKSMKMVKRYSHLSTGHLAGVMERMTQTFLPSPEERP